MSISVVQRYLSGSSGVSAASHGFSGAGSTSAGSLLVVLVNLGTAGLTLTSVSDDAGNTFQIDSAFVVNATHVGVASCANAKATSGANTLTVTASGPTAQIVCEALEVSSPDGWNPAAYVDISPVLGASGTTRDNVAALSVSAGPATSTKPHAIAFGVFGYKHGGSPAITFTRGAESAGSFAANKTSGQFASIAGEYVITSSAGSQSFTGTLSAAPSEDSIAAVVVYYDKNAANTPSAPVTTAAAPATHDEQRQGLWRVILTDLAGNALSNLTKVATAKVLTVTRNRPAAFQFTVKSDDATVATIQDDGFPLLAPVVRGVRAYRCEVQADGSFKYVLRFAGHVWQLEDDGDADTAKTTVVCYDPLMRLNKLRVRRMKYSAANGYFTWTLGGKDDTTYVFDTLASVRGSLIATALVDRANSTQWSGMSSAAPAFSPTFSAHSQPVSVADGSYAPHFEYVMVTDMLVQLSEQYNAFDFQCIPDESSVTLPTTGATVKQFGYLSLFYPTQGVLQKKLALGWGYPPNNVVSIKATLDAQNLANDLLAIGNAITSSRANGPSKLTYGGAYEDIVQYSDTSVQGQLDGLANEELALTAYAKAIVEIAIQAGHPFANLLPFDNFGIGDTLIVNAGPKLRGGFVGAQLRVEQFTLTIDDDKGESVTISSTPVSG